MVLFIFGLLVLGAGVHAQVPPPPPPPVTPTQFLANKCFSACPPITRTHVYRLTRRAQAPSPPPPILPERRLPIPSALTELAPLCVPALQAPWRREEKPNPCPLLALGPLRSNARAFAHSRRRCRATALRYARVDRPHRDWQCGIFQLSAPAARRATFSSRPLARSTSETLAGVRWSWLHRKLHHRHVLECQRQQVSSDARPLGPFCLL